MVCFAGGDPERDHPQNNKKWARRCCPLMPLCLLFDLEKRQPLGGKTIICYICKMLKHFFFPSFLKSAILIKYEILKSISRQLSCLHPTKCASIHRAPCCFFGVFVFFFQLSLCLFAGQHFVFSVSRLEYVFTSAVARGFVCHSKIKIKNLHLLKSEQHSPSNRLVRLNQRKGH